ncbi:hypothetical protein [Plebeiibacterium marinum]|uniref:Polysaccharide (De)acetylase n=1 Tax=Plebeiibacterium marinum TaxID=2992111 RepID=A0AAE3MB16_9BACT|nr:hypothetical protein [Plebeiobacterium marinum]MCW3804147.1 hypothetical protein [Plebeiobacterium marinum]
MKTKIIKNIKGLYNLFGWSTSRKIVVIESDDWGSIRMPSIEVYNKFRQKGFDLTNSDYNRLDSLECNDDLSELLGVLDSYKDSIGNSAVITANMVVGNPDFRKIKESGFTEYHVEKVEETLSRYDHHDRVLSLWKEGYSKHLFYPQFHAREHVNVVRWMDELNKRTKEILYSFENGTTFSGKGDYSFMEVLDYNTPKDLHFMKESLKEGLNMFEELFGFRSKSFIPPCYAWDSNVEDTLAKGGVKYIQGLFVQCVPTGTFGEYKRKYHFMGSKNSYGQRYLVRNCFFEPSITNNNDPVGECLQRIQYSFRYNKPAIISSHRINFIGALVKKNREVNLILLGKLLKEIVKRWPDVEFMTSDQLGDLMTAND